MNMSRVRRSEERNGIIHNFSPEKGNCLRKETI